MNKTHSFPAWFLGVLLSIIVVICQSTAFAPIEAGTFYITAGDLKGLNKKTTKEIQLQTPWNVFNQNLNINIACVISAINIDQRVSLQWNYNLVDRLIGESTSDKKKVILVEIVDKKGFVYENFKLGINYMIAQNLRTDNYNMTDFQQHLMNQSLTEQQANPTNKEVHNELFLFPNGFSSFNLTHHVMYSYVTPPYDMYTIHYMTNMQAEHDKQGWHQGKDFIYYRYILHPKYQFGYNGCPTVYESYLEKDFYYNCNKGGIDGYFFGLAGYSSANFAGHFQMTRTGFSFKIEQANNDSMYNVLAVPYKISQKFNFIDHRIRPYDYVEEKSFFVYLIAAVVLLVAIIVIIVILKKKKVIYFNLQQQKLPQMTSQTLEGQNKKRKSSPSKNSTKNKSAYNTYEDEMKEQPFNHSDIRSEIEVKNENFAIE